MVLSFTARLDPSIKYTYTRWAPASGRSSLEDCSLHPGLATKEEKNLGTKIYGVIILYYYITGSGLIISYLLINKRGKVCQCEEISLSCFFTLNIPGLTVQGMAATAPLAPACHSY